MVATHLPSNVLLILVPLMPNLPLAIFVLLVRFSISQMDVPTRQSYIMAVVSPEERSAAAGITGVARTIGAAISPLFVGFMFARPSLINLPFFIAGTLKIVYDLLLYKEFAPFNRRRRCRGNRSPPPRSNQAACYSTSIRIIPSCRDVMKSSPSRLRPMNRSARVTVAPLVASISSRKVTYVRFPFGPRR